MVKVIRREVRRRGFFGWVFLVIFLAFNAFMAAWMYAYWSSISEVAATSEAAKTGKIVGVTIATGILLTFWAMGSVVTGLLALLTRGRKTIIEETIEG